MTAATDRLRLAAAFLLDWCACGAVLALLTYLRTENALADIRAAADPIMKLRSQAAFDEGRSGFVAAVVFGVALPAALMAAGFAVLSGARAARRSKPLPK